MLVNGKKIEINDLLNEVNCQDNFLQKANDNLDLTGYQISVLKRLQIDYEHAGSLKELIYLIEEALDETEDEELEIIAKEIAERDYYENSRK